MYTECRHIKTNGLKCESPSLKGMPYCYFHNRLHNLARAPRPAPDEPIDLPVLEDSATIQLALTQILQGVGSKNLDPRRAGLCLYALQIATQHVERNPVIFGDELVQSLDHSPDGDELAPQKHVCGDDEDCDDCPDADFCERCVFLEQEDEDQQDETGNEDENER